MRDVKWEYGDIVLDSAGRSELLSESDSEFQRALIRMSAKRGCFIYDRELGADCENIWGDTLLKQYDRAFCEALAPCENTSARAFMVTYNGVRAEISVNGETRTKEVRHYG